MNVNDLHSLAPMVGSTAQYFTMASSFTRAFASLEPTPEPAVWPSIAVLRPLARADDQLEANFEALAWVPVENVELRVGDAVSVRIRVTAPAVDGVRYEGDHELAITGDAMVLAWADATAPLPSVLPLAHAVPIGFSGPLWVDANGDGAVRLSARVAVANQPPAR